MLIYRLGPEGFLAADRGDGEPRWLHSDPFVEPSTEWRFGRPVDLAAGHLMAPVMPGKIVGIGRSYEAHATELDNPVPDEPAIFLKAPSSVIGTGAPIVLPPESERVELEGEVAVVLGRRLGRAADGSPTAAAARAAILGLTCACDVTARDLQRRDPTFARAKSFDSFCPLGPALHILAENDGTEIDSRGLVTRLNGEVRQRARTEEMLWGVVDLVRYVATMMTLEPGDVVLTGTPAGVAQIRDGDEVEVEVEGIGVLRNKVEAWRRC